VRVETKLRLPSPSSKQDENKGLRTRRQVELYIEREKARQARAERREAEARVRHLNFDLIQRMVLLVIGASIGAAASLGVLGDPQLLKPAAIAASTWGVVAAALYRFRSRRDDGS